MELLLAGKIDKRKLEMLAVGVRQMQEYLATLSYLKLAAAL